MVLHLDEQAVGEVLRWDSPMRVGATGAPEPSLLTMPTP
jgi:hypothetical protein